MAFRMKLNEQAIRFMIRVISTDISWVAKRKIIDEFITRNGKIYGRKNAEQAIVEAKKILAMTWLPHG